MCACKNVIRLNCENIMSQRFKSHSKYKSVIDRDPNDSIHWV